MAVKQISKVTPKPFLGTQITNPKILAPKIQELVNVVNAIQTGSLVLDSVESLTTVEAPTGLIVGTGSQTGSDTPTINFVSGTIITAVTATAGLAVKTVTLTNSTITAASKVFVSIGDYGGTGIPLVYQVTPAASSVVIKIYNAHASVALSAAFDIDFLVVN